MNDFVNQKGDARGHSHLQDVKIARQTIFTDKKFNRTKRLLQLVGLVVALLLLVACGGQTPTESAVAEPDTAVTEPTEEAEEVEEAAAAEEMAEESTDSAFPVTIEHKYGSTEIPEQPQRVVSVGYSEQDELLALGVIPVGVREWYGGYPYEVWPWAQDELGDAQPETIGAGELNFEAITALDPDLIVGVTSGMTQEEYDLLSQIAPTVAQPGEYVDYGTPWQEVTRILGQATGHSELADEIVTDLENRFAEIREAHPEFEGATLAVAFAFDGSPGVYASQDTRPRLLSELGFVTPEVYDEVAGDSFYITFSEEELPTMLDVDTVVWLAGSDEGIELIREHPLRPSLRIAEEGREVFLGALLGGAFSFSSPLSINYLLDELVPMLEAAVDGDPATAVADASGAMEESAEEEMEEAAAAEEAVAAGETRTFVDAMDREVNIPVDPQRIVVLSEIDLDSLLALGLTPVGAPNGRGQLTLPTYLQPIIEDQTTAIGGLGEPNLETILTLEPDLIVYSDPYGPLAEMIPELEQIAPVVVPYVYNDDWHWKTVFTAIAEAMDKSAEAEAWLESYESRAATLGEQLPEDLNEVSIVRWMADGPRILLPNAFSSQVLDDVGFERPEHQLDLAGTHPVHTDVISMEQVDLINADIIFAGGLNPEGDVVMQEALENPLVQALTAVQAGRLFEVDGLAWSSTGGPMAAENVLDDVESALNAAQ